MPRGRPPITFDNSEVHSRLQPYYRWKDAAEDYSGLEHILVGVCWLDYGNNSRPLSMAVVFQLLRDLPQISTASVQDAYFRIIGARCHLKHAQKICPGLRVASRALSQLFAEVAAPERGAKDSEEFRFDVGDFWFRPLVSVSPSLPA